MHCPVCNAPPAICANKPVAAVRYQRDFKFGLLRLAREERNVAVALCFRV